MCLFSCAFVYNLAIRMEMNLHRMRPRKNAASLCIGTLYHTVYATNVSFLVSENGISKIFSI